MIGALSFAIIVALRRWAPRVPGALVSVVGAMLAVSALGLADHGAIEVVGALPQGLPRVGLPHVAPHDWLALAGTSAAIALVSFTDISLLSRTYELRTGHAVERNKEFIALGVANMACAFAHGFPVGASGSRTPVAEAAGAKTQLTGIFASCIIALLLLFAPRIMRHLPLASLAAVVTAASAGLLEIASVLRLYRLRRNEFVQSIVCTLGVVTLGVVNGVGIALALALLAFVWRAWRPYTAVLGRIDGVKGYHDIGRHPDARRIPGLVLFRWDAPLFFANAEIFHDRVMQVVKDAPTPTREIVIAAEPVTDIDVTAADMFARLLDELHEAHVQLGFAELKGPVKDSLKRYGIFERIGADRFSPTIGRAVDRYLNEQDVQWHDWEDDERPGTPGPPPR
ncbi:SulP family inorganic anion transporter [Trinickia caryophylli]